MARVAVVTGGTRGIGEAISLALRDQGVTVAANYAGNEEKARAFTDRTGIKAYPAKGITRVAVAAPGFSADCLETLEELGIRGREDFLAAGGAHFARLDCLNDSAEGIAMLERLVRRELEGWLPAA